jgi:hypothetical protein
VRLEERGNSKTRERNTRTKGFLFFFSVLFSFIISPTLRVFFLSIFVYFASESKFGRFLVAGAKATE